MKKLYVNIPVNHHYYDDTLEGDNDYCNEQEIQKKLGKSQKDKVLSSFLDKEYTVKDLKISTPIFGDLVSDKTDSFVLKICKNDNQEIIFKTGLYIGRVKLSDGIIVNINSGYNDEFLKRMLRVGNNINFIKSSGDIEKNNGNSKLNTHILEFLFVSSFKEAFEFGLPRIFEQKKERGLNIKGKIDPIKYIIEDYPNGANINYQYNKLTYVPEIVNIIYKAFTKIDRKFLNDYFENGSKYINILKEIYVSNGNKSIETNNAKVSKALSNNMYFKYKKVIKYADLLIKNKGNDINKDEESFNYLIDISKLWEDYLVSLLKGNLEGFKISAQEEIEIGNNTFFKRSIRPDIVGESESKVFVIDAKFKTMKYRGEDIDRNDLHQIRSYGLHYLLKDENRFKFCALAYPTRESKKESTFSNIIETKPFKMGVLDYLVGDSLEEILKNEKEFIDKIKNLF